MPSIFSFHGGDGEIGAGNVPIRPDPWHSSNLEKQLAWHSPLRVGVTMGEDIPWPLSWTGNMTWGNASVLSAAEVCSFLFFIVFNLFIYFNWRLITLKYCNAFCHTLTWISHGCTCVTHAEPCLPPPSPSSWALLSWFGKELYQCMSSVVSNSLWPHGLQPARLLCPWDSPGKKTGAGCHALFELYRWGFIETIGDNR